MKKFVIFLIILIVAIILYGFYIEPTRLKITENNIKIANMPESFNSFKIIQFSDLLYGSTKNIEDLKIIVNKINDLKPDIVVFTGDLISKDYKITAEEQNSIINELNKIDVTLYKYAIIGDNDLNYLDTYKTIINNSNFKLLDNETLYLFYKDKQPLKITGLTNMNELDKALQTEEDLNAFASIILTHYPDYIDTLKDYNIDIVLAGHSLHGQIRIPFLGAILNKDNARIYKDNYYLVNNTKLYVSGGLGTEYISFRLLNSPEINLYRLTQ